MRLYKNNNGIRVKKMKKENKLIFNILKWLTVFILLLLGCTTENDNMNIEELKSEIINTEKEFAQLAKDEGIVKAFLTYAADDAVLNRNNTLISGKKAIRKYFDNQTITEIKLDWKPDFVDVSKSGDLAYTYGKYTFSAIDSKGEKINSSGIFHTVWKKQMDGSWKYVWD